MTKDKKQKFELGQEVFIIDTDLSIIPKKIVGFKKDDEELKYQLNVSYCHGVSEQTLFKTKNKAKVEKKNFLDNLKFKVGDLVVFEYKEYNHREKTIGLIRDIVYSGTPYKVQGTYRELYNISDENIFLKIKNEFIENYGNLQELYNEFEEKHIEMSNLLKVIFKKHDNLEKELKTSIKKQYGLFNWNKSKPKFTDRFSYERVKGYD